MTQQPKRFSMMGKDIVFTSDELLEFNKAYNQAYAKARTAGLNEIAGHVAGIIGVATCTIEINRRKMN